jgi:hypothetical protein
LALTCPRLQADEGRLSRRTPIEAANERAYLGGAMTIPSAPPARPVFFS